MLLFNVSSTLTLICTTGLLISVFARQGKPEFETLFGKIMGVGFAIGFIGLVFYLVYMIWTL